MGRNKTSQELRDNRPVFDGMEAMLGSDESGDAIEPVLDRFLVNDGGKLTYNGVELSAIGINWKGKQLSEDSCKTLLTQMWTLEDGIQWIVGDTLAFSEKQYGETFAKYIKETERDYSTLANWKSVCLSVQFSRRRELLTFSHHAEVAGLKPKEQTEWLDKAVNEGGKRWSVRKLRREIEKAKGIEPEPEPQPKPKSVGELTQSYVEEIESNWDRYTPNEMYEAAHDLIKTGKRWLSEIESRR